MSICRSCRLPLWNAPTRDWLKLKCQACGSSFCYSCGESSHFPAHCTENRKWLTRDFPNRSDFKPEIKKSCEMMWSSLNMMMRRIEDLKRKYIEEEGTYEFLELYYKHPHLRHAVSEICSAIELLRWIEVVLSLNPLLEYLARESYDSVLAKLRNLISCIPPPEAPIEPFELSSQREELGQAVSVILMKIYKARLSTHVTPFPHAPAGAVPVWDNEVFHPRAITLPMTVAVPPGFTLLEEAPAGSDETYLALVYLESVKWEGFFHARR